MTELSRRAIGCAAGGLLLGCTRLDRIELSGAGATLPAHQYARWLLAYAERLRRVSIAYLPIGSGGGIRQLAAGTVDFGASDVAIDDAERSLLGREVLSIPTAIVAVGICYNLPGNPALRISRGLCASIYLGAIERWNAAALAAENPGVALPDLPIAPIFRADGGGSTALFTNGLAAKSRELSDRIGTGRGARFQVGIGAHGSDGVVDVVSSTPGAIGYVEVDHALRAGLPIAALDDGAGGFVEPTRAAVLRGYSEHGATRAYPLASPTFLLLPLLWADAAKGAAMARFAYWVVGEGQRDLAQRGSDTLAASLLPLPAPLAADTQAELGRLRSGPTNLLAID